MYQLGQKEKSKRRRKFIWLGLVLCLLGAGWFGANQLRQMKPVTTIKQSKAITTKVASSSSATKHYEETDFMVDLPSGWQAVPRPGGPYTSFTWQKSDSGTDGQQIVIYEDTIPTNFAVNRVLIVHSEADHLAQDGGISENCSTYTNGQSSTPNQVGAPAKWQGVAFLCDQSNMARDVIGTSSTEGVNTVTLKRVGINTPHKFFFTYTDHSMNPDYTVFSNFLNSFHMQ